jgi:hypothetical protein
MNDFRKAMERAAALADPERVKRVLADMRTCHPLVRPEGEAWTRVVGVLYAAVSMSSDMYTRDDIVRDLMSAYVALQQFRAELRRPVVDQELTEYVAPGGAPAVENPA